MKNLFVFGNGVDLAHGMKTTYQDFIESNKKEYQEKYGRFSDCDNLWNNIEDRHLKNIEEISDEREYVDIYEQTNQILQDYGLDKYGEPQYYGGSIEIYNNSIMELQEETEMIMEFEKDFKKYLQNNYNDDMIKQIKAFEMIKKALQNEENIIINFNYTHTLEIVYGCENVIHVHGNIDDEIIIGCGKVDDLKTEKIDDTDPKDIPCADKFDLQEKMIYFEEDGYANEMIYNLFYTVKNEVHEKEKEFYDELEKRNKNNYKTRQSCIEKIKKEQFGSVYIIGHSLGNADYEVFDAINRETPVICFYHDKEDKNKKEIILEEMKFKYSLISDECIYMN